MSLNISPRAGAAIARYAGTIALTALIAIQPSYPSAHWMAPVILVLGYLGYHAVPTAVQVVQKLMPSTAPTQPLQPLVISNQKLTDAEVAAIRANFAKLYPVQSPPVPDPASQAGSPTVATETADMET